MSGISSDSIEQNTPSSKPRFWCLGGTFSPTEQIQREIDLLENLVVKTGSPAEHEAMNLLRRQLESTSPQTSETFGHEAVRPRPSRLHFGFLSTPSLEIPRAYGGVGLMIDEPAVELIGRLSPRGVEPTIASRSASVAPGILQRIERIRNGVARQLGLEHDEIASIEVLSSPPQHVGLGVGTQLSLSVAKVVSCCAGRNVSAEDLAKITGRGQRSSIGIHGWKWGGLRVEAGKIAPGEMGPLVAGHSFPEDWNVLLVLPSLAPGKHGQVEEKAIKSHVLLSPDMTRILCENVLLRMLPALHERDIDSFGRALADYNRLVGQCFAAVQGGPYADPMIEAMIDWLGKKGIGGAQSSWGPTTFAIVQGEERTYRTGSELATHFGLTSKQWRVTSASKSSATLQWREPIDSN